MMPTYGAPTMVAPGVVGGFGEIDRVNAFGQVVERDFVGGVPTIAAPAVMPTYGAPTMVAPGVVGGFGEIDRVNAFGQVVERDFVGGVPRMVSGFPSMLPPT